MQPLSSAFDASSGALGFCASSIGIGRFTSDPYTPVRPFDA
jgi:hypothetical protein